MATVDVQYNYVFGLRRGVTNDLCFLDEHTVLFPSGNNCVRYHLDHKWQKFVPGVYCTVVVVADMLLPVWSCTHCTVLGIITCHTSKGQRQSVFIVTCTVHHNTGPFWTVTFLAGHSTHSTQKTQK